MRTKKKNTMRSPEEKETIILEYLNDQHQSYRKTADKYEISGSTFRKWKKAYLEFGIDGLRSQTGKTSHGFNHLAGLRSKKNKTKEEELQFKVMKLEIEVARLKKGYQVKGVGSKKEYVTIKDLNTKS